MPSMTTSSLPEPSPEDFQAAKGGAKGTEEKLLGESLILSWTEGWEVCHHSLKGGAECLMQRTGNEGFRMKEKRDTERGADTNRKDAILVKRPKGATKGGTMAAPQQRRRGMADKISRVFYLFTFFPNLLGLIAN